MQHINQIAKRVTSISSEKKQQQSTEDQSAASEQSINLIIDLFEDWVRVYGNKVKDHQSLDLRTAELWALAFRNLSLTYAEFKEAAALSMSLEWCPSSPADFVALVRNNSSYPDIRQAYKDAANQQYNHEVVYEAARRVGFWEMRTQPESVTYKAWQSVYPKVCEEHRGGASFKVNKSHRIEHKHTPAAPDSKVMQDWDKFVSRIKGRRSCEM